MAYCRFRNTYSDLEDCYESLENKAVDEVSEEERETAKKLIYLCQKIADEFLESDWMQDRLND